MSMNHGQSQQSPRWYKLCFIPTSGDSSDDSDTESVIISPSTATQTSTWQQPSPPHPSLSPRNPDPEIDWLCPPPPPPLPIFTPSRLSVRSVPPLQFQTVNPEPRINQRSSQPSLLSSQPPNPEPRINWSSLLPPPPPPFFPPSPTLLPLEFPASNSEPRINLQYSIPPPAPPLPRQDPWDRFINTFPSLTTHGRPDDDDHSQFLRSHMVKISKLHLKDDLSHCPICMEEFKLGDQACQLPCNHTFKFECILLWLNTSKTCPVCRRQLDGFEGQGYYFNIDDGFEGQGSSYSIGDDEESLDLEPQIPPQVTNSLQNLFQSSLDSHVIEDDAGENSDEAEYDSACDELGWY